MPLKLTWAEREILVNHSWGPGPILDMFAPLAFRVLHAGHTLGLFKMLREDGPTAVGDICRKTGADESGMTLLLDTLCSLGYLRKRGSLFVNSAMTRSWMLGSADLSSLLGYFGDVLDRWSALADAVLGGRPAERGDVWLGRDPARRQRYQAGLRATARLIAPQVAARSKLPRTAARLIDMGGGHGLYSVEFCRRYPGLSAVIFDQPHARDSALSTIAEHAMEDRISYAAGDILSDSPGIGFDCALMVNFARVFTEQKLSTVLRTTFDVLNPGGKIVVADQFHVPRRRSFAQANSLFIMLELFTMGTGKIYTAAEIGTMLLSAGFARIRQTRLPRSPGMGLVTAVRP